MAGKKAETKARKAADKTSVPVFDPNKPCEYIEIKPAGVKGHGAFACKDIAAGTVILKEKSIMTIHQHQDDIEPWDVEAAYLKLSPEDKRIFDSMRECTCDVSYCKGRMAIFAGNQFNVAEDWSIVGAYAVSSRLNHSCAANCVTISQDCKGEQRVSENHDILALKHIRKGEELTFSYVQNVQYMTTTERRAYFQKSEKTGWICQCDLCSLPAKERPASDLRRCIMGHLEFWITQNGEGVAIEPSAIKLPFRKLNSFQIASYTLLFGCLAEAEGLSFRTCRWRWWGFIRPAMHIMLRASDKKLEKLRLETLFRIMPWWFKAHVATDAAMMLELNDDKILHGAIGDFAKAVDPFNGKIHWERLSRDTQMVLKWHAGETLDY